MSSPTEAQIEKVKNNLTNMIAWNQQLQVEGNTKILNAYALLTLSDNHDLGLQIGLNLMCGSINAINSLLGPVGAVSANFLDGVVGHYATETPPSLNATLSSLLTRFQATSEQLQLTLEEFHSDPESNWNTEYSGTVNTPFGSHTASGSLSELSTIDFPSASHPDFTTMLEAAQFSLDQCVWAQLLQNFVITKYYPSTMYKCKYYTEQDMENNAASFYGVHPSYWNNWTYVNHVHKGKDKSYYDYNQNNIGTGASTFSDGHLNDSACQYLFIDSYDNVIINPKGLFQRSFVFNNLAGIKHTTHTYQHLDKTKGARIPDLAMEHGMTRLCWDTQLNAKQRENIIRSASKINTRLKLEDSASSKIKREIEIRAEIIDQVELIQRAVEQVLSICKEEDFDEGETDEILGSLQTFMKLFATRERAAAVATAELRKFARNIKKALMYDKEKHRRRSSLTVDMSKRMNALAFK